MKSEDKCLKQDLHGLEELNKRYTKGCLIFLSSLKNG
jgi:hypothetical protein